MARSFEVILPSAQRAALVGHLRGKAGIISLSVQKDTSIDPAGDVLTIWATNEGASTVLHSLDGLGMEDKLSFIISEPTSIVARPRQRDIEYETNEGAWEEVAALLRRDTNLTANFLILMTLAGAVAAVGLWNGTLHLVIGAMLIAPGFEPIMRFPFALIGARGQGLRQSISGTVIGYGCLAAGAAAMLLILTWGGDSGTQALRDRPLVQYWTTISLADALTALAAGCAGATIVSSRRTVFGAGVMVALALIPSMAIVGMGLVFGDTGLAAQGLARWALDLACVFAAGGGTLGLKQLLRHRRRSLEHPDRVQTL